MANNQLPGAILRRLSRVRAIESQLVDRLDQLGTAGAIDPEEHEVLRDAVVARRSGAVAGSGLRGRRDRRRRPCRPGRDALCDRCYRGIDRRLGIDRPRPNARRHGRVRKETPRTGGRPEP